MVFIFNPAMFLVKVRRTHLHLDTSVGWEHYLNQHCPPSSLKHSLCAPPHHPHPVPPPKRPRFRDPTSYDCKQVQLNPDDLNGRVNITTLLSAWLAGSLYILQQFSSRHGPRTVHTLIRYGFGA